MEEIISQLELLERVSSRQTGLYLSGAPSPAPPAPVAVVVTIADPVVWVMESAVQDCYVTCSCCDSYVPAVALPLHAAGHCAAVCDETEREFGDTECHSLAHFGQAHLAACTVKLAAA